MLQKLQHIGKETKMSLLSLTAVLGLHLIHYMSAPMLMGAAAGMHSHQHGSEAGGSAFMALLMLALFIVNLIGMYYAARQLILAWKKRESGAATHTYLCTLVSVSVLGAGIYTAVNL